MKKRIRNIISVFVVLTSLFLAIHYISKNIDDFKQIDLINPFWFLPLIPLFLINYFFIGIQTKALLKPLGVHLQGKEAFMLAIVTGFYNLITPAKGGMGVRAIYLKKKHSFAFTDFFSSLAGMYVISFFLASLLGLISTYLLHLSYGFFNTAIFLVFISLFIPLLVIIIAPPKWKETENEFLNKLIKVVNGWNLIRKNKKVVRICLLATLYSLLSISISIMATYYIFDIRVTFIQALFLASVGSLSLLMQITPAGLGINEAIGVFSALVIGITPVQSIPAAIVGRSVQIISLFTLGPIFSYKLLKYRK